jgi:hypothetical protein
MLSDTTAHQIGRHVGQPVVTAFCPAVFDADVTVLDIAGFAQALTKGVHENLGRLIW